MMYPQLPLLLATAATAVTTQYPSWCKTCQSFGDNPVDFGTYTVSSTSTQNFNATQEFAGCQPDSSYNVLADPTGKQYQCTRTPITPDNTKVTTTCPIQQGQMTAGTWTLIVQANNGVCRSINYKRTFDVVVNDNAPKFGSAVLMASAGRTPDRVNDDVLVTIPLKGLNEKKLKSDASHQPSRS